MSTIEIGQLYSGLAESNLIPVGIIEEGAGIVVLLVALAVLYKYTIWKRSIPKGLFSDAKKHLGLYTLIKLFLSELGNRVALQRDIITDSRVRRATHLMVFWGFWGLVFATTWTYVFYGDGTPRPLNDLGKVVGNVGGALVIAGCTIMLVRYAIYEKYKKGAGFEVAFFSMLYLTTITGFASELARISSNQLLLYSVYAVHFAFIVAMLVTAPFTHFFHALLVPFERYVGRIHEAMLTKGIIPYVDYRKGNMIDLAADIKFGDAKPVYPSWLWNARNKQSKKN